MTTELKTKNSIASLRRAIEGTGKFQVQQSGDKLKVSKLYGGKEITCTLTKKENSNKFTLDLSYLYTNSISFFDWKTPESRFCRNKLAMASFFNDLKKAEVWHLVDKSNVIINENNRKAGNKKTKSMLEELLSN